MDHGPLTRGTIERLCSTALGRATRVVGVQRLRGGTKKGVFRVTTTAGDSVVLYTWHDEEDWWSGSSDPAADVEPFTAASGMDLLTSAHECLTTLGVRVPRLLLAEPRSAQLPADCAVVEDVPGRSLEQLLSADEDAAAAVLAELRGFLLRMAAATNTSFGKVGCAHTAGQGRAFHEVVLQRARRHLAAAAVREPRLAAATGRVCDVLHQRAEALRPMEERPYSLVHGELGPDHVLVDADGRPVLIDLEGVMWADVEWEHAFLELRFHEHYEALRLPGLDEDRLRLYRLALHLSLVEGPLRLIETGFPDREFMAGIAEHNLRLVLAAL